MSLQLKSLVLWIQFLVHSALLHWDSTFPSVYTSRTQCNCSLLLYLWFILCLNCGFEADNTGFPRLPKHYRTAVVHLTHTVSLTHTCTCFITIWLTFYLIEACASRHANNLLVLLSTHTEQLMNMTARTVSVCVSVLTNMESEVQASLSFLFLWTTKQFMKWTKKKSNF